jgi:mannose-6-phosphate isomerase-like protein (cupin superfamily)
VLASGDTYVNPRSGGRLTILEHWTDNAERRFVFERRLPPRTGRLDPHKHLDHHQRYEVLSGRASIALDGRRERLGAGETIDLPPGTSHRDPFNDGSGELVYRATFEPVTPFLHAYVPTLADAFATARTNRQDELSRLLTFVVLRATNGETYAAGIPMAMQAVLRPVLAAVGRLCGYRALVE